jgi:hypothetical protein
LKNPGYTAKRSIIEAERFARERLGIAEIDYRGDIEIANACNRAILATSRRGVPMPAGLRAKSFRGQEGEDPDEIAAYVAGLGNCPGEIYLNLDHPAWNMRPCCGRLVEMD